MFTEDLSQFFADFGVDATLAGVGVRGTFDSESVEVFGGDAQTIAPSFLLPTTSVASRLPGQALVIAAGNVPAQLAHVAGTYSVREVIFEPQDGAMTRLMLTRA